MTNTKSFSRSLLISWPELTTKEIGELFLSFLATIISLILAISAIKPKVKTSTPVLGYIDYDKNQSVEERELTISWGHIFEKRILLPKIPRTAEFKLFYKPPTSYTNDLPMDYFKEVAESSERVIMLKEKMFHEEPEVDRVYMETKTPLEDVSYKKKINHTFQQKSLQITNDNHEEIRNYPILLPSYINISQINLPAVYEHLINLENPKDGSNERIKIYVKKIPPREGNTLGTLTFHSFLNIKQ